MSWALGMLNEFDFGLIEIRAFQKAVLSASASSFKCVLISFTGITAYSTTYLIIGCN